MKIETVRGLKNIPDFSIVDAHIHVWLEFADKQASWQMFLTDNLPLIGGSLKDFKKAGGGLVIDCTPPSCGRNANKYLEISENTNVEIVSVTGFHKKQHYPDLQGVWGFNIARAAEFFCIEVANGLEEALNKNKKIKAGLIKIAYTASLEDGYKVLTDAAIKAALITNVPLIIHTEQAINVEWISHYLEEKGINPAKVVLSHVDKNPDTELHERLASRGFYLEYDTFLRNKYDPEKNTYPLLDAMIKDGFSNSLMIASDMFGNNMWESVNKTIYL